MDTYSSDDKLLADYHYLSEKGRNKVSNYLKNYKRIERMECEQKDELMEQNIPDWDEAQSSQALDRFFKALGSVASQSRNTEETGSGNSESGNDSSTITLRCSFCGKPQNLVDRMIAGNHAYICDECVKLCMEIVSEPENLSE